MFGSNKQILQPQKPMSWWYYLPWVGALIWVIITILRRLAEGSSLLDAELLGAALAAAIFGFMVTVFVGAFVFLIRAATRFMVKATRSLKP